MGGSGGFFRGYTDTNQLKQMVEQAAAKTRSETVEIEVAERLDELLIEYNDRDAEKIRAYLNKIKELLQEDIEGTIDLRFGGSISKHTYVDGLSDVDCLVHLKDPQLESMSPQQVLQYFREKIEQRLGKLVQVSIGDLAVTVEYPDGTKLQLLPTVKRGAGLIIPTSRGNTWSNIIHPDKFAERLTEVNQACNGKVVPTIKLVKAITNRLIPEEHRLTGYHIESLAIEIFKSYSGSITIKSMIERFFERAKDLIMRNIRDKTGQSVNVDGYLGSENSGLRQAISHDLENISRNIMNANTQADASSWLEAIGEQ